MPKAWREQLAAEGTRSGRSRVHREVRAADGTRKFLLQLADGHVVETVGIPLDNEDRHSLTCCVSSQARTLFAFAESPASAHGAVGHFCMLGEGVRSVILAGAFSMHARGWMSAGDHEM